MGLNDRSKLGRDGLRSVAPPEPRAKAAAAPGLGAVGHHLAEQLGAVVEVGFGPVLVRRVARVSGRIVHRHQIETDQIVGSRQVVEVTAETCRHHRLPKAAASKAPNPQPSLRHNDTKQSPRSCRARRSSSLNSRVTSCTGAGLR